MSYLRRIPTAWIVIAVLAILLYAVAPALLSGFRLSLLGKYLCYAIVAVGIGLAWGRGGMLVLGQGVFFGLGGYLMAMHLKLADAGPGGVPDFMSLYGSGAVPTWWEPFRDPLVTVLAILVLPAALAVLLGLAIFRRRVRGAYFAILSQALAAAFAILLIGQQASTGGTNGLVGFRSFFGYDLSDPVNQRMVYLFTVTALLLLLLACWQLYRSRYGELLVAVRDSEERVRFLGYNPANVKLVAYALAAFMAGIGGALFVPVVGMISPADVGIVPSIAFLTGVAIGGRATLFGPAIGAVAVAAAQTRLSEQFPGFWIYFQGLLFVVVIAFLPQGFATIGQVWRRRRGQQVSAAAVAGEPASLGVDPAENTPSRSGTPGSDTHELEGAAR